MNPFKYPIEKHSRTQRPRRFKNYKTYKKFLRVEFSRKCVYCRQPDSSAPNLNFGVDHYKPSSRPEFAGLKYEYTNLYYCCGSCNSHKNSYWPEDETAGMYVVNPCDFRMAEHMVFDNSNGSVVGRSDYGRFTIELLQLDNAELIAYRRNLLLTMSVLDENIKRANSGKRKLNKMRKKSKISATDYADAVRDIDVQIHKLKDALDRLTGDLPIQPIGTHRMNIKITT